MNQLQEQREALARKMLKQPETPFKALDIFAAKVRPKGMTRAFQNNRYTVMVFDLSPTSHGVATKVLIQSHFNKPITNHWSELFRIKNEIFGEEIAAIEYHPAKSELIDEKNIYWLWIFPAGVLPKPIY